MRPKPYIVDMATTSMVTATVIIIAIMAIENLGIMDVTTALH